MATGTVNIASGSTVFDTFAQLIASNIALDLTPPHRLLLQNDGTGTVRFGDPADVQGGNGPKLGPGDRVALNVPRGARVGLVGDGGSAAASISIIMQIGG